MHVHLSTSPVGDVFSSQWTSKIRRNQDEGLPSFVWENITYGDWKENRVVDYEVPIPDVSLAYPVFVDTMRRLTGQL
jgi:hypothetical protein